MIHPWRVNRLINAPELRVLLQPALCFPAFVDNVVVHDQRDGFRPTVCRFKPLQQADEQRRTFAVAAHIADFTCPAVQRSGQIIFFILSRRDHPFLLSAQLPVRTDFGMKMDIHFIFIKDLMFCAAFVQCFMDCYHLFIFMRVTDTQSWRSPSPHNPRRRQPAANGSGI